MSDLAELEFIIAGGVLVSIALAWWMADGKSTGPK